MGSSLELSVFDKHCIDTLLLGVNSSSEFVSAMKARGRELIIQEAVAQNPFRSLKIIFDHSNVRFTANPKLALQAQTTGFAGVSLH
jgi:hypothetical protein